MPKFEIMKHKSTLLIIIMVFLGSVFADGVIAQETANSSSATAKEKYYPVKPVPANIDSLKMLVYNNINYVEYYNRFRSSNRQRLTGIMMTSISGGIILLTGGITIYNSTHQDEYESMESGFFTAFAVVFFAGATIVSMIGVPILIKGSIMRKNNLEALQKCRKPEMSLKFGLTQSGVGLMLNF